MKCNEKKKGSGKVKEIRQRERRDNVEIEDDRKK